MWVVTSNVDLIGSAVLKFNGFIRFENVARAAEGGEEDQGVAGG